MEKEVTTESLNVKTGKLKTDAKLIYNLTTRTAHHEFTFEKGTYAGECTFEQILDDTTNQQKAITNAMIKKTRRLCINNKIKLKEPFTDEDITGDLVTKDEPEPVPEIFPED